MNSTYHSTYIGTPLQTSPWVSCVKNHFYPLSSTDKIATIYHLSIQDEPHQRTLVYSIIGTRQCPRSNQLSISFSINRPTNSIIRVPTMISTFNLLPSKAMQPHHESAYDDDYFCQRITALHVWSVRYPRHHQSSHRQIFTPPLCSLEDRPFSLVTGPTSNKDGLPTSMYHKPPAPPTNFIPWQYVQLLEVKSKTNLKSISTSYEPKFVASSKYIMNSI